MEFEIIDIREKTGWRRLNLDNVEVEVKLPNGKRKIITLFTSSQRNEERILNYIRNKVCTGHQWTAPTKTMRNNLKNLIGRKVQSSTPSTRENNETR